jgi:hypothetical protein
VNESVRFAPRLARLELDIVAHIEWDKAVRTVRDGDYSFSVEVPAKTAERPHGGLGNTLDSTGVRRNQQS